MVGSRRRTPWDVLPDCACGICAGQMGRHRDEPPAVVINPRGTALCNFCAPALLEVPLEDALAAASVSDRYTILDEGVARPAIDTEPWAGHDVVWRPTHLYQRRNGDRIVAAMRSGAGSTTDRAVASRSPRGAADIGSAQANWRRRNLTCSFCCRGCRTTTLLFVGTRLKRRPALVCCADCLAVACLLFRVDGVLSSAEVVLLRG
jgi:hypothetical protein